MKGSAQEHAVFLGDFVFMGIQPQTIRFHLLRNETEWWVMLGLLTQFNYDFEHDLHSSGL